MTPKPMSAEENSCVHLDDNDGMCWYCFGEAIRRAKQEAYIRGKLDGLKEGDSCTSKSMEIAYDRGKRDYEKANLTDRYYLTGRINGFNEALEEAAKIVEELPDDWTQTDLVHTIRSLKSEVSK